MQVESIAPMFNLDPGRPLWIVRKAGNIAVWPRGGKFTGPLVTPGSAYEVRGHVPPASPLPTSLPGSDTRRDLLSPFGIYTSPTCSIAGPSHVKKKTWNKSIMIISVRRREGKKDAWKGNTKVDYEVVTQTHVTLDASSCTVRRVAELLKRQLDMEVVLLDSKCYPLTENESTSSESFWKSSRKILAANKSLYNKVSGQSTNVMRASIDLTRGDASEESDSSGSSQLEPSTKRPCLSSSLTAKLDEIAEGVSNIQKVLMFMKNMQQTFQCVICKGVVSTPTVAKCCGRIVGCQGCVASWLQGHASCPHCASPIEGQFLLRGLDEVLQALQATVEEQTTAPPAPITATRQCPAVPSDSDSDFDDLPRYRV